MERISQSGHYIASRLDAYIKVLEHIALVAKREGYIEMEEAFRLEILMNYIENALVYLDRAVELDRYKIL